MVGGSAPSQASGAPYRTESGSRWPSPARQNDMCNRGYGIYPFFSGPDDTLRTLYTPIAKSSNQGSFQDFAGTEKVPETIFPGKYNFAANGTAQFGPKIDDEVLATNVTSRNYTSIPTPFFENGKKLDNDSGCCKKESKPKKLSREIVLIKSENEGRNKMQEENMNLIEGQSIRETDSVLNKNNYKKKENGLSQTQSEETKEHKIGDVLTNEPDSTEFQNTNEARESRSVRESSRENPEKETVCLANETDIYRTIPVDSFEDNKTIEVNTSIEKCNTTVISEINKKKMEKISVKVDSMNDICSPLNEKKFGNSNNNCNNLLIINKKTYSESSKPSPTRTLTLSPQNGGCSRTTPVTFKLSSLQEPYPKPQNTPIEFSSVFIKKEPSDFQKNLANPHFLTSPHLNNNFFTPGGLNVFDGQLLSPVSYSNSFRSSKVERDNFFTNLNQDFPSPNQDFLSPRAMTSSPFLSPTIDIAKFGAFKNYSNHSKCGENVSVNKNDENSADDVYLKNLECVREARQTDSQIFINTTTTTETESMNKVQENITSTGFNVTPCQVAEVTSASSLLSPNHSNINPSLVKQETTTAASSSGSTTSTTLVDQNKETAFMSSGQSTIVSSTVGVPSTRQRCQQRLSEIEMASDGMSSSPVVPRPAQSSIEIPPALGTTVFAGNMLNERPANLITTWPAPSHNPTLWQYSTPIDYPPFPPVGFQLVRDPITGHFLLIPASNLEALQRAILWPSYQTSPPQMIIPPLSVQPSSPHILLDTNVPAVDFLTSETIHHSAPQHRILIAPENSSKRKNSTPTVIKLESSECSNALVVTTGDSSNICSKKQSATFSPSVEAVFPSQKNVAALGTEKKSQATSPVIKNLHNQCDLNNSCHAEKTQTVTLQDACNQTDLPFDTSGKESEFRNLAISSKDKFTPYIKTTEQSLKVINTQDVSTETVFLGEPEDDKRTVLREIRKKKEALNVDCPDIPHNINIKKEIISPSQVDLSGLELLSNSIEQFECDTECQKNQVKNDDDDEERKDLSSDACEGAVLLQNLKNGFRETEETETYKTETSDNLGGLGLLCALAEQRFQEEIGKAEESSEIITDTIIETKVEKDDDSVDVNSNKELEDKKCESESQSDSDDLPKLKKEIEKTCDNPKTSGVNKKLSKEKYKNNELRKSSLGSEKFIPKRGPGRPRKLRSLEDDNSVLKPFLSCKSNHNSKEMSPPVLEKETDLPDLEHSKIMNSKEDILKPPTLIPSAILDPVIKTMAGTLELTPCEVNLIAFNINTDKIKNMERADGILFENEGKKRKIFEKDEFHSSAKKRKVGRPRKHHFEEENSSTETIVAKKPRTKPFLFQPTQTVEISNGVKTKDIEDTTSEKLERSKNNVVKLDENEMIASDSEEEKKTKKIKPKLKAEAKLKDWAVVQTEKFARKKNIKKENNSKQKIQTEKKVVIEEKYVVEIERTNGTKESSLPSCLLTTEDLKSEKFPIRTLTVMGGLFYAGQLSAIRAPDVYGITIDGERGNRPHIYSREEILKDSILEVKPEKTSDLVPGTRCCAYWSEQYRCLYPGTVAAPASPEPELDDKFINVEFDDGDSGKINIEDIRFLPKDYPIVEYDPNPLQSLSKRKRRISGASVESHSKERKSREFSPKPECNKNSKTDSIGEDTESKKLIQVYERENFLSLESERRHLKKKRREKLKRLQSLSIDGKKKHKKHKCSDEHRHHRHHKKHRKHRHKHGKRHGGEANNEIKRGDEKIEESLSRIKEEPRVKKGSKNKYKSVDNSCKLSEKSKVIKPKKCKERTDSVESRSKMAAFLPARQLWGWSGKGYRRPGAKGRARKEFYKTIQRGKERITVGDCAVFLSTGRPDRPYIGRIESMWESWGTNMIVRVKWFYHPEETVGCPASLEYPGALFESPHVDENDVQTISHKCEVLPLKEYIAKLGNDPQKYETIYDNNDIYYLAGYYDPTNTTLKMEPGVK